MNLGLTIILNNILQNSQNHLNQTTLYERVHLILCNENRFMDDLRSKKYNFFWKECIVKKKHNATGDKNTRQR